MRALITGAGGQLGRELVRRVPAGVTLHALDRAGLDITDSKAVEAAFEHFRPTQVINAAAYTAVDQAESNPDAARALNAQAPAHLIAAARRLGNCRLVHISTDYVFDGESAAAYSPTSPTNPLNVYGASKLEGERLVLSGNRADAIVVRTAWVYAAHGRNFVHTMLRLMRERGSVQVVSDQIGSPTAAGPLAEVLWKLAARTEISGIYHWSDAGVASWYDFAVAIAEEALARGLLSRAPQVTPIATEAFPTPARRPRCSLLDKRATASVLGSEPLHWRTQLRAVLDEMSHG